MVLEAEEPRPSRADKPIARGLAKVPERRFAPVGGELGGVLGGKVPLHGTVLVTGPGGAGKSTLVAALALERMRAGARVVILDAEMDDTLARGTWVRGGATEKELGELQRVSDDEITWREALDALEELRPNVVVVDSIDEWSERGGRDVVLADIRRKGPLAERVLILAIAHYAREGHLFGSVKADHRADAVVVVEVERISQRKCTWHPKAEITR